MLFRQLDIDGTQEVWSRYMLAFFADPQFYAYEWFHETKPKEAKRDRRQNPNHRR
jgi:hypothetical protein